VVAQGAYLEKGENGFGGEARVVWTMEEFRGVGIFSGYSIAGILDIGAHIGYMLGEVEGSSSSELGIAFDYKVNVLKQTVRVPFSLQIIGSYGLVNVSSEYLDNNDLERTGTGYTIGLSLSRNFRITSFWLIRLNLLTDYESISYTDMKVVTTTTGENVVNVDNREHVGNIFFGGGLGFLLVFPRGPTLAVQAELRADQDLELQIHPIIALAFPQK